jgi:hypothetical protein
VELFKRSLDEYLEPICPSVTDATRTDVDFDVAIFNDKYGDDNTRNIMEAILGKHTNLGFIFMECLDDFETLWSVLDTGDDEYYEIRQAMAIYELWRLYNLGYVHGDPHQKNILFDPFCVYIDGIDGEFAGRAIMIDFGRTYRHKTKNTDNLETIIKNNLKATGSPNYPSYRWLVNIIKDKEVLERYNQFFSAIRERRENKKQQFLEYIQGSGSGREINYETPGYLPSVLGGAVAATMSMAPWSSPSETSYVKQGQVKGQIPTVTVAPSTSKDAVTASVPPNRFAAFDPENKLTVENIKKYIETENHNADNVLKTLKEKITVGGGRRKKNKKTRKQNRKRVMTKKRKSRSSTKR